MAVQSMLTCPPNRARLRPREEYMRTTKILIGVCLAVIMAAGSTTSALAQQKATGGQIAPGAKPPLALSPDKGIPLTQNECLALGGETSNLKSCVTGMMCTTKTVDKAGVTTEHTQCVTKAE